MLALATALVIAIGIIVLSMVVCSAEGPSDITDITKRNRDWLIAYDPHSLMLVGDYRHNNAETSK